MKQQIRSKTASIKQTGHALSLFIAISYVACVAWGMVTPWQMHMHEFWATLLPGFVWLTPLGFFIGLLESYFYGWWIALIYVPLFHLFGKPQETPE